MEIMAQAGIIVAVLVWAIFTIAWILDAKTRRKHSLNAGTWIDAFGFALLPAISVWKIFEPYTVFNAAGKAVTAAGTPGFPVSGDGRLIPWRIELCAALIAFAAITIWMMLRKKDLNGNGDLMLTVLCIWSAVRSVTESTRETHFRVGPVSIAVSASIVVSIIVLAVWSIRRGRKQKSAGLTALEWIIVFGCGTLILLTDAGIIMPGSAAADIVLSAGCAVLSAVMILFAGKDSREA